MQEVWKPISGFESFYEVSSHGRVRSFDRISHHKDGTKTSRAGRLLKPALRAGYPFINLCIDGEHQQAHVHRLVADAFCEKPDGCDVVNHLDGEKTNNAATNLEWTTPKGNAQHAISTKLKVALSGEDAGSARLKAEQVNEIRRRLISGESCSSVAGDYGVKVMCISDIRRGVRWLHGRGVDQSLVSTCSATPVVKLSGAAHPGAKLAVADVEKIIRLLCDKVQQKDIAALVGANTVTISNINLGNAWSTVRVDGCGEPPYFLRSARRKPKPDCSEPIR